MKSVEAIEALTLTAQRRLVRRRTRLFGKASGPTLVAEGILGVSLRESGLIEEAAGLQLNSLRKAQRRYPDNHPLVARAQLSLGITRLKQGELTESVESLESARNGFQDAIQQGQYSDHSKWLTLSEEYMAIALYRIGAVERAIEMMRSVVATREGSTGSWSVGCLQSAERLASWLTEVGTYSEARDRFIQIIAHRAGSTGNQGSDAGLSRAHLSNVLWCIGDDASALIESERALEAFGIEPDSSDVRFLRAVVIRVEQLLGTGDTDAANLLGRHLGDRYPEVAAFVTSETARSPFMKYDRLLGIDWSE